MSDAPTAIQVEELGKRYRIGAVEEQSDTLASAVARLVRQPIENLKRLRRLTSFDDDEADDIIWALREIDFTVKEGEIVGVIGKNGSGKSTLLKILSHITPPTRGRVTLRGRVSSLLEVGTGFHQELTGRENIYLNGTILGMTKAEIDKKFDEIVDFAGTGTFLDTPVKRYSSGMRVRLAFSVAAHLEPEILLVDEVLAVGDVAFQKKCLSKMSEVVKHQRTVLFVSHNMGVVRNLCPRCILLENGRMVIDGDAETVIGHYLKQAYKDSQDWGLRAWGEEEAPGGDEMRLREIALLADDGEITNVFDIRRPVRVRITYEALRPIEGSRMVMMIATPEGEIAFASIAPQVTRLEPGLYRSTCILPPGLLNQRVYTVRVVSDIPYVRFLLPADQDYLSFHLAGGGQQGARPEDRWPGIVHPELEWQPTETLEPARLVVTTRED
ncbi:MAG: ABC transporter ATP-binding protein [Acidobacteriota bacterium]